MNRIEKDAFWMQCIQQCRVSGLSDYAWCNQNDISISSFYYNVKRLRDKASSIPTTVTKVVEKPEIVLIHYNELQENKVEISQQYNDPIAIQLEFHGVTIGISNSADSSIISATLKALQQLC